MARENSIAISDKERELLREARVDIFGTNEVPYGETIRVLVEKYND